MAWRVAASLLALRDQVNAAWPTRNRASDGTIGDPAHQSRSSDHNPWIREGSVGVVSALDITHDPNSGCDAGKIAGWVRTSRDSRVKYMIFNKRICNSSAVNGVAAWTWRAYGGPNPHTKHIHISVKATKSLYDSSAPWALQGVPEPADPISPTVSHRPVLRLKSRGAAVRELQKLLGTHGHALAVDGRFGPNTDAAVRAFQAQAGLDVDGVVGAKTWAALIRSPGQ